MKRKRTRFTNKMKELNPYEKHMLIQEIIQQDTPAVQHFLSVLGTTGTDCVISNGIGEAAEPLQSSITAGNGCTAHTDDTGCKVLQPIYCYYCYQDAGPAPGNPNRWNGFKDMDMKRLVCSSCITHHYQTKYKSEHKNLYSEFPVVYAPG